MRSGLDPLWISTRSSRSNPKKSIDDDDRQVQKAQWVLKGMRAWTTFRGEELAWMA